jgi:hypothetical protein
MIFIKLTNASPGHEGDPIMINMDFIVSIWVLKENDKLVTVLYSNTNQSWHVSESMQDINKILRPKL